MRLFLFISFFLVLVSLGFTSCEKDLNVTFSQSEKLVINGILEINEPISLTLSHTRNILDENDSIDFVRNAEVYLRLDDNSYQEIMEYQKNGIYSATKIAEYSEAYTIEIVHAKYKGVKASGLMPLKSKAIVKAIETSDDEDMYFQLEINNLIQGNYYIWEMVYDDDVLNLETEVILLSRDEKTDNILPDETRTRNRIFMRGNVVEGTSVNSVFVAKNLNRNEISKVKVRLLTVNEDMYTYYKSLELYRNSVNNFVEPIEIYSNVVNGLGIFGAFSETVIEIDL